MKKVLFALSCLLLCHISAFAEKYEAESASLSGGATVNGTYVSMQEGDISFAVSVQSAGTYDILIRYANGNDGSKTQNIVINGTAAGSVVFPVTGGNTSWNEITSVVSLIQGANTVAITKSWGWVNIDYIDVSKHENVPFELSPNTANPNANAQAKKVFAFMQENFQKKIISGVMTNEILNGNNAVALNNQTEVKYIRDNSGGKTPALVGFDFMHATGKEAGGQWQKSYSNATVTLAKELYNKGGIPAFCWHWRDPSQTNNEFYSPSSDNTPTDFDLTTACTNANCDSWNTNSNAYKSIVADIDVIAEYLKELQDAGVAVLWRPVHEASGGWFWWGYKGAKPFKLLYKLIFDRLTTDKGLNNLIWVWNSDGADADWYPGDDFVDIIGRDYYYYPRETNHASLVGEFESIKNLFGTSKMISLAENGSVPYPDNLKNDGAGWSYFMPWYGDYVTSDNSTSDWNIIMNNSYVLTLEDMPGWDAYEAPTPIVSAVAGGANFDYRSLNFSQVRVYNIRGVRVFANNWAELPKGIYVVRFKGESRKIRIGL